MAYATEGIWFSIFDISNSEVVGTEGTHYATIPLQKLTDPRDYEVNVRRNSGGVFYAMNMGKFGGLHVAQSKLTLAQLKLLEKFISYVNDLRPSFIYMIVVVSGTIGSGGVIVRPYYYQGTEYNYLKCLITGVSPSFTMENGFYDTTITIDECWAI